MLSFRTDTGTLRPAKRLPNGQLLVDAAISRAGVFTYRRADGSTVREYRSPEEVFSQASIDSYLAAFVTNNHPNGMVDVKNAKGVTVGTIQGKPRRDGDHLVATMVIFDGDSIAEIENGKVECSCGYHADVLIGEGTSPDGERFDAAQKEIKGNHVAIVDAGRAGSSVRVRLDAGDAVQVRHDAAEGKNDMDEMKKALDAALADAAAQKARADVAEGALTAITTELSQEKARADKAESDLTAEKTLRTDAADGFDARVTARVALVAAGEKVLGEDFKADMTDREIRIACVAKLDADAKLDDKDDVYVRAYFDSCMSKEVEVDSANAALVVAAGAAKKDSVNPAVAARNKMIEDNQTAWQN